MSTKSTIARLGQLARIGWATRKIRQSRSDADRALAKKALAALLADARGVSMKIGQLFAGHDEADPFRALVTSVSPMPLQIIRPFIEAELGVPVKDVFASLDEASAAASLGQVHRGVLQSGHVVAVKIRYPDIGDAIDAELQLAGLMPSVGPVKRWGVDIEAYKRTLRDNLARELDYRSEAQRQQAYAGAVVVPGLHVPIVHPALCTEKLLVQEWADGVRLDAALQWPRKDKLHIARTLLLALFRSLFVAGEVHADPHIGNYLFRKTDAGDPEVVLMDFGCTVSVPVERRLALLGLIAAFREGRDIDALGAFSAVGFDQEKLAHIADTLPALCRILFQPFVQEGGFDVAEWKLGQRIEALLGERRWWFRSAGPSDLLLLMRAFQGLAHHLDMLNALLPWWPLLELAVGADVLQQARLRAPGPAPGVPLPSSGMATSLSVQVLENGVERVAVTMPSAMAYELDAIIPDDVRVQLRRAGLVEPRDIVERLYQTGLVPQELFRFTSGSKSYRVWLA
jgi:predicted unusual protein kinase regulating ubiquinone biosynthesis (AarF/ABC1/UbiB family)